MKVSSRGFSVSGTAGEKPCAGAPAAIRRKQRVKHVWVSVYRGVGHGRCRFVLGHGRLGRRRSCLEAVEFRSGGTGHWHLKRKLHLAPGRCVIRADAVDFFGRHQRRTAVSAVHVRVR